jgi:hypothetical protein
MDSRSITFFTAVDLLPGGDLESGPGDSFPVLLHRGALPARPSFPCVMLEPGSPLIDALAHGGVDSAGYSFLGDLLRLGSTGLLLPFLLHNLNNNFVGVVGNLDLASMFAGQPEKCSAKVEEARSATGSVRGYLDVISRIADPGQNAAPATLASALEAASRLALAGKGRSMDVEMADPGQCAGIHFPAGAVPACCGLAGASLLMLSGSGSISIGIARNGSPPGFELSWARSGTGRHITPGRSSVPALLLACACVAVGAGAFIRISPWGEGGGGAEVSMPAGATEP